MKRCAQAIHDLHQAKRYRRSGGLSGALLADGLEAKAKQLLTAGADVAVSAGEAVPKPPAVAGDALPPAEYIKNTLEAPDAIAIDASEARTSRAAEAGVLELAVDAAQSIQARNSLEKMLAHQLAAAHDAAMQLLARAFDAKNPPAETTRLTNAAARLIQVYQEGFLALHRVRTGGKQVVTVQHVVVAEGGQAVVAGSIERGAYGKGEGGRS